MKISPLGRSSPGGRRALLAILTLTLLLRFVGIARIDRFIGDEAMHVPAATNYIAKGTTSPDNWFHPHLRHVILYGSIRAFGENPYGWRMRNVLFGTLTVLFVFLAARELFGNHRPAVLAALMLGVDPLHIFFSRTTMDEIQGAMFFTAAVYFTLRHVRGNTYSAVAAGICLGLAHATKWYYPVAWIVLAGYAFMATDSRGHTSRIRLFFFRSACFVFLPMSVYFWSFLRWFLRGYGFPEFIRMQIDAYERLNSVTLGDYLNPGLEMLAASAWKWFVAPIVNGFILWEQGGWTMAIIFMNNPLTWLLVLPSCSFAIFRSLRNRTAQPGVLALVFAATYVPFLLVGKTMLMYSSLAGLPVAFILVGFALDDLTKKFSRRELVFQAIVVTIVVVGLYLFPLAAMAPVPATLYKPVFMFADLL